MDNFYDLLKKIQKRLDLYLGRKSIFSLQAFLDGYYYARREIHTKSCFNTIVVLLLPPADRRPPSLHDNIFI
jgi:hypothetical protein